MKRVIIISIMILLNLSGCFWQEDRFIRKEIEEDEIILQWFYYSRISNNSPDYVEIKKADETVQILEAVGIIANCEIEGKIIRIKLFKPERGIIYGKTLSEVFGYQIVLDSTATREEYYSRPDGKKR